MKFTMLLMSLTSWLFMCNVHCVLSANDVTPTAAPTSPPTSPPTEVPTTPNVTVSPAPVTTVPPTTVAPEPTPAPGFDKKQYNLTSGNLTCLSAEFALQFKLNGSIVNVTDAKVINQCPPDGNQNTTLLPLELQFSKDQHLVTLLFQRNLADNSTFLANVSLQVGGTKDNYTFPASTFKAEGLKSYRCSALTSLPASINGTSNPDYTANFKDVKISHPFHFVDGDDVNGEFVCPADDDMDDKIPLAVGAALIVLVAIVIISYYVGVRRSRRLTYQSV